MIQKIVNQQVSDPSKKTPGRKRRHLLKYLDLDVESNDSTTPKVGWRMLSGEVPEGSVHESQTEIALPGSDTSYLRNVIDAWYLTLFSDDKSFKQDPLMNQVLGYFESVNNGAEVNSIDPELLDSIGLHSEVAIDSFIEINNVRSAVLESIPVVKDQAIEKVTKMNQKDSVAEGHIKEVVEMFCPVDALSKYAKGKSDTKFMAALSEAIRIKFGEQMLRQSADSEQYWRKELQVKCDLSRAYKKDVDEGELDTGELVTELNTLRGKYKRYLAQIGQYSGSSSRDDDLKSQPSPNTDNMLVLLDNLIEILSINDSLRLELELELHQAELELADACLLYTSDAADE